LLIHTQEEFDMSEINRRFWRRTAATALPAVGIAGVATSLSQSPGGKWWFGYGNGADNSITLTQKNGGNSVSGIAAIF
jgi:hypothetical protein